MVQTNWREARAITINAVVTNADLVARILTDNVGVATYVAARGVCRAWRAACDENEELLLAVARYAGGLTKRDFMWLMRLTPLQADGYPRERRLRAHGGHYYLYRIGACESALRDMGGLTGWGGRAGRLQRGRALWPTSRPTAVSSLVHGERQWQREEALNQRARKL